MRFLPFKGANTCDLRDPDLLFLGPHQPRPSCGRQRLPAHFSPQPIAEADCSGQHAIRKRPKPRAASPSAGPGSRGPGDRGAAGSRGQERLRRRARLSGRPGPRGPSPPLPRLEPRTSERPPLPAQTPQLSRCCTPQIHF